MIGAFLKRTWAISCFWAWLLFEKTHSFLFGFSKTKWLNENFQTREKQKIIIFCSDRNPFYKNTSNNMFFFAYSYSFYGGCQNVWPDETYSICETKWGSKQKLGLKCRGFVCADLNDNFFVGNVTFQTFFQTLHFQNLEYG